MTAAKRKRTVRAPQSKAIKIGESLRAWSRRPQQLMTRKHPAGWSPFMPAKPPPGVLPEKAAPLAMDAYPGMGWAAQGYLNSAFAEGQEFLGYPELAILSQRAEYRQIFTTIATEMTREWLSFTVDGKADRTDKVKNIEDEFERLQVRSMFRRVTEQDGQFGRAHLFIDTGTEKSAELAMSIGNGRDEISKGKISKGLIKRLATVEPIWTYPTNYNSVNPLAPTWYNPDTWFVMGQQVHRTRLLRFVAREVPDILKPAYSFGGLSLIQIAKPYVDNWLRTRQSVSDLIHAFTVFILMTDTAALSQMGSEQIQQHIDFFLSVRDNKNLMVLNKTSEEFKNVSVPLSGLSELQAQSQEHMAAVSGIPLVKFTGITPQGLNASSDGEIRVFYDKIAAEQEAYYGDAMRSILGFVQLNLFGEVDPTIGFSFKPLWQLDDAGKAAVQKTIADIHDVYLTANVVSGEEVRQSLAGDENSPYQGLSAELPDDIDDLDVADPERGGAIKDPGNPLQRIATRSASLGATSGV